MLLSGVSAMADSTYSSGNQSVTISNSNKITVNDYNTVLIAKNTGRYSDCDAWDNTDIKKA